MTDQTGTHGERVKARILAAGLALWPNVSARGIGRQIGLTHQAVLYHYGSADALSDAVAQHAVSTRDTRVVPVLITTRHPAVADMTDDDKRGYLSRC